MPDPIPEGTDMQRRFEGMRLWPKRAWLVAFVVWWAIGQIAASATCVAQGAPEPAVHPNGTRPKAAVYIVDEIECKAKAPPAQPATEEEGPLAWSDTEHWAWKQICKHLNVDFDEKEANEFADRRAAKGSPEHDKFYLDRLKELRAVSPEERANDESRRLSGDFLAKIFGNEKFRHHTWNEPLKLFGFSTDRLVIDTAALRSLDIRRAYVESFIIRNTTVGDLWLDNVHSANIQLNMVTAKRFRLENVSIAARNFGLAQPSLNALKSDGALEISTTRIEDWMSIRGGRYDVIDLNYLKVGDLFIDHPAWNSSNVSNRPQLSITQSVDNGVFSFHVNPEALPNRINLNQFIFANAYLGPDPMPVIRAMEANAEAEAVKTKAQPTLLYRSRPDLEPYTLIAKSYAQRGETGISDRVLIAKNVQDRRHLASIVSVDYGLLALTWIGFHPGLGLVLIGLCVLLGWRIFRYASNHLAEGSYIPKSPFLLALDSVIPVIRLDKRHEDVRYDGWPQRMLYLLRILGAVLVFLALSYMQKRLLG
jgi:hypothetical protein